MVGDDATLMLNSSGQLNSITSSHPDHGNPDIITTGEGHDIVIGGRGDDIIETGTDSQGDVVVGDNATLNFTTIGQLQTIATTFPIANHGETAIDGSTISYQDTITTGTGNDIIIGGLGDDAIISNDAEVRDVVVGDGVEITLDVSTLLDAPKVYAFTHLPLEITSIDPEFTGEDTINTGSGDDLSLIHI